MMTRSPPVPLDREVEFFEKMRAEWLKNHEGRFALIKDEDVSFHDTDEEAYKTGVDKWGDVPMLIKQVLPEDLMEDSLSLLYGLLNATG